MKNSLKFFAGIAVFASLAFALPNRDGSKEINVVIDAGHGGKDHGAAYGSFTEKQIVNQIAKKVKEMNKDAEVTINFTRVSDEFVSLEDRVNAINSLKPDVVLSLHVNFLNNETASGMEFFVSKDAKEHEKAEKYAKLLEQKFVANNGYKSRGVKAAPFYILKKSDAPTISFQMGFLSNSADRSYLTNIEQQEKIAATVLDFINEIK